MKQVTITMRLFGAFRKFGEVVELTVPAGSQAKAIKLALENVLGNEARALIGDSVLANDDTILPGDFVIEQDSNLSILPPVCGG